MSRTPRTAAVPTRGLALLLFAALVVAAGAVSFRDSASAHGTATATLRMSELDKGASYAHIRNTKTRFPRSNQLGDLIVFTNPLVDPAGKRIGTLHADCTTTIGARDFLKSTMTCQGVASLTGGTLTVQLVTSPGIATTTGAVTGGTGAYADARGVFVSTHTDTGADDVYTLIAG